MFNLWTVEPHDNASASGTGSNNTSGIEETFLKQQATSNYTLKDDLIICSSL